MANRLIPIFFPDELLAAIERHCGAGTRDASRAALVRRAVVELLAREGTAVGTPSGLTNRPDGETIDQAA